jgi:hypothetical protein
MKATLLQPYPQGPSWSTISCPRPTPLPNLQVACLPQSSPANLGFLQLLQGPEQIPASDCSPCYSSTQSSLPRDFLHQIHLYLRALAHSSFSLKLFHRSMRFWCNIFGTQISYQTNFVDSNVYQQINRSTKWILLSFYILCNKLYIMLMEYYSAMKRNGTCKNRDEPWEHGIEWKRPGIKHLMLYDSGIWNS